MELCAFHCIKLNRVKLKKAVAIWIWLVMLVQCCAHYSIIAMYALRKDYIAANLCENRGKPEMKCLGKCYLKKQLKKLTKSSDNKGIPYEKEQQELPVYVLPQMTVLPPILWYTQLAWYVANNNMYKFNMSDFVFRPPVCDRSNFLPLHYKINT